MSEDTTTTTEQESVQAAEQPQPEEPETQAVQAEEVSETSEADTTNQTESSEEDLAELVGWAERKGIKVNDDTKPLLKMVKESEQKMHSATQEAKALKSTVNTVGEEQGYDETSQLLNRLKVTEFYLNNPEAKQLDEQMAEIVTAKPYLAEDLETVYELAKARSSAVNNVAAKQQGQKEALAQVAKAEKAAPPNASATTREGVKQVDDAAIAAMSLAEYNAWKRESGFNPFQS